MMTCDCRFDEDGDESEDDEYDDVAEPIGIDGNGAPIERRWVDGEEVIAHYDDLTDGDVCVVDGIRCTTALRTVIDLAPELDHDHLVRMVRDCLKRNLFTVKEAWDRLGQADMTTRAGALRLRSVLPEPPGAAVG